MGFFLQMRLNCRTYLVLIEPGRKERVSSHISAMIAGSMQSAFSVLHVLGLVQVEKREEMRSNSSTALHLNHSPP